MIEAPIGTTCIKFADDEFATLIRAFDYGTPDEGAFAPGDEPVPLEIVQQVSDILHAPYSSVNGLMLNAQQVAVLDSCFRVGSEDRQDIDNAHWASIIAKLAAPEYH